MTHALWRSRSQRGVTLYEVVASMVVLAAIYLAVTSLQVATVRGARDSFEHEMAREIASHQLSQATAMRLSETFPVDLQGMREVDGIVYHWSTHFQPVAGAPAPSFLRRVTVRVRWVGRRGPNEDLLESMAAYPLVANPPPPSPTPSPGPRRRAT